MYDGDPDSLPGPASMDSDPSSDDCAESASGDLTIALASDIPSPKRQALAKIDEGKKRYAHHGKRRRRFTEELFRCQYVDKISRSDLVCNSLLWKNRPAELRSHLQEHLTLDQIGKMTDDEVEKWYVDAKRIFLQGIPEDLDDNEDEELDSDPL